MPAPWQVAQVIDSYRHDRPLATVPHSEPVPLQAEQVSGSGVAVADEVGSGSGSSLSQPSQECRAATWRQR